MTATFQNNQCILAYGVSSSEIQMLQVQKLLTLVKPSAEIKEIYLSGNRQMMSQLIMK